MEQKTCVKCGNEFPEESFPVAGTVKGKLYRRRKCQSCYWGIKKLRRHTLHKQIQELKKNFKCQECGIDDIRVLEFHHMDDDKEFNIGDSAGRGYSMKRILEEMEKCVCLCANHHRILHYEANIGV